MLNAIGIFVLRLNNKAVTDGQFMLASFELIATVIIVGMIVNN